MIPLGWIIIRGANAIDLDLLEGARNNPRFSPRTLERLLLNSQKHMQDKVLHHAEQKMYEKGKYYFQSDTGKIIYRSEKGKPSPTIILDVKSITGDILLPYLLEKKYNIQTGESIPHNLDLMKSILPYGPN